MSIEPITLHEGQAPPAFYVGVDLGQADDYSAAVVVKAADFGGVRHLDVVHLERYRHVPYPDVLARITALIGDARLRPPCHYAPAGGCGGYRGVMLHDRPRPRVAVDRLGPGAPIADALAKLADAGDLDVDVTPIALTAGHDWRREGRGYNVPKRLIQQCTRVEMECGRLKVVPTLKFAAVLKEELLNFTVKLTAAGNETYAALRESEHDDLAIACQMAVWLAAGPAEAAGGVSGPLTLTEGDDGRWHVREGW